MISITGRVRLGTEHQILQHPDVRSEDTDRYQSVLLRWRALQEPVISCGIITDLLQENQGDIHSPASVPGVQRPCSMPRHLLD